MISLYIWGAGGHGRVVLDCAVDCGYEPEFIEDDVQLHETRVSGRRVHAPETALARAVAYDAAFSVAIGNNRVRAARFQTALERRLRAAILIHPSALVSPWAEIGEGTVIMPGVIVNSGARIGRNVIVNTGAIVEHDCRIGDHVHLAPRSTMGGGVIVETFAFLGIGAMAIPGIVVGEAAVVGAGAVLIRDVPGGLTVAGVPARPVPAPFLAGAFS